MLGRWAEDVSESLLSPLVVELREKVTDKIAAIETMSKPTLRKEAGVRRF